MNIAASATTHTVSIARRDACSPILIVAGAGVVSIRGGTTILIGADRFAFDVDTPIAIGDLIAGEDYGVRIAADGSPVAGLFGPDKPLENGWFAGFHYAPGGNAFARSGGDSVAAINPHSLWDAGFRPACPDPRGMAFVESESGHRFWIDIYLLGVEHERNGTSRCGATIADGNSLDRLNYHDVGKLFSGHGKRLQTYDEFRIAAFGVTEKSSATCHPNTTGLDVARTSRAGLMQATGNLWQWGTDGDPDDPRPSIFGGSWIDGSFAGSRYANLGDWAESSNEVISARGASDHLSA